jgi:hypothetical protein
MMGWPRFNPNDPVQARREKGVDHPSFREVQYFFSDLLKPGEYRYNEGCILIGRGTDMEALMFDLNLSKYDLDFLKGCRISLT